ncbi:MAG: hypothetical protein KDA57_13710 [Planctomycetales bacterium]|nr:hypothetical protein [Planctomycetales bacterium]
MRIYPSHLSRVAMEPQSEDFRVIDVDADRGQGVMVLRSFREGEVLFRMNGRLTKELTLHSLQLAPDLHLDDPYVAGKVLHSCAPNSRLDVSTREFIAERDIEYGELLTMDYECTEDVLYRPFWCRCGEAGCRGEIVGRLFSEASRQNGTSVPGSELLASE